MPSWVTPPTFTPLEQLTSANMNIISGDIAYLGNTQSASAVGLVTTSSTSFVDLGGPSVTIQTGAHALVILQANVTATVQYGNPVVGYVVSGSTSIPADINHAMIATSPVGDYGPACCAMFPVTGLNAGLNTFTMVYEVLPVVPCTGNFFRRYLIVIPLP